MRWALVLALTAAYPLIVYFSLGHVEPRYLALLLLVLGGLRWLAGGAQVVQARWVALAALALAASTALLNASLPLKLYPALVNAVLLVVFGLSLVRGPNIAERLARLQDPVLDDRALAYTRSVTQVWCGFFVLNGSLALATALWATEEVWALYNGLIAYVLIGLLMGGEWLLRRALRAKYAREAAA
ncbi:hypothetical protein [Roseateles asaccharophilus]|uniref:Membrane protein n=1 Tax=Roseateles asaccharophilus TaxID=582607 RepID=A0ABU2A6G1_9BURK|nr:hypothetical protein [Roseateles asaccharophilus]MDR7332782.1 putative membrane protein [Roseateles asaccharophilus]